MDQTQTLEQKVEERKAEAIQKEIFQKAVHIINYVGQVAEGGLDNNPYRFLGGYSSIGERMEGKITPGGEVWRIHPPDFPSKKGFQIYFYQGYVQITIDGNPVFEAESPLTTNGIDLKLLKIESYIPGDWTQELDRTYAVSQREKIRLTKEEKKRDTEYRRKEREKKETELRDKFGLN